MKQYLVSAWSWWMAIAACAATWLIVAGGQAATSPPRKSAEPAWQPPLTLANPFVAHSATSEITEAPVAGDVVTSDLPPIYRLPPVDNPARIEPAPAPDPIVLPPVDRSSPQPEDLPPLTEPQDAQARADVPAPLDGAPGRSGGSPGTAALAIMPPPYAPRVAVPDIYLTSSSELTTQLLPAMQHGFTLAGRGALFAARADFIHVLRRIAEANDAERASHDHSQALADGLRALEEANDFVPSGVGLEGELNVPIIVSSHRTPVVRDRLAKSTEAASRPDWAGPMERPSSILPHEAAAMYHDYAVERLAAAVAGQQAGSMALFGLGKICARLSVERPDEQVVNNRGAITMYAAAVAACPANPLAANEMGVLLCRNGHAAEAVPLFLRTIDAAPSSTAYHNLAVAEQKLGRYGQAAANQREADRLAAWERATGAVSRRAGIEWVPPAELARVAPPPVPTVPLAESPPPTRPAAAAIGAPLPETPWQKAVNLARSVTGTERESVRR